MEYLQQFVCFFFHFLGFVCGILMVVAQKMQRSVNEKLVKAVGSVPNAEAYRVSKADDKVVEEPLNVEFLE